MICGLCGRDVARTTRHHLIPRKRHRSRKSRGLPGREVLGATVALCYPCHQHIHALFSEKELEELYPTVESLLAHPDVRAFVVWVSRQADAAVKRSRRKR
jgi:hypothetical protein